ncbi:N-acetylgalactosamine kinase [Sabethes cyaneus]|uniref:N-acetylgalactosamine kinase n=1 Tax=Sabethes cyaneus TaxID=53552 RepID=UPI00237DFC16|nr:N-acetylgalactosamine kinase [Sabethes cyaneus]XP_053683044.1 N-acetylgalactosamine kinase [Sabethes cyaneus]XP_053683045.1 N-acetylgalactosamine kinase [Sabethes cyaneus]
MSGGDRSDSTNVNVLEIPTECDRVSQLKAYFLSTFNRNPKFIVRCSGRVNIIGEHVDYCGYPVLPMAIEQTILVAVAPSEDNLIHVKNIDPKYKPFKCNINTFTIDLDQSGGPEWYKYFLCGIKGILEYEKPSVIHGMMIVLSGNIPSASGLSSSSAIVSASVLCSAYLHNVPLVKQTLATISAECERYIGTQGGGMDQAIAYLAKQGCAQFIEWDPLRATSINLPANAVFVIANSLTEANKAANSDFNQRVVECRLACRILAKQMQLNWRQICRFADLQQALSYSLEEMETLAHTYLTQMAYSTADLLTIFEIEHDDFVENLLTANTRDAQIFKLKQRALHVLQESMRVHTFVTVARQQSEAAIQIMKQLMRKSHESLRTLYECSHPNLDKLVQLSDSLGIGARLTGAGWGGCIVALCDGIDESLHYIKCLSQTYYANHPQAKGRDIKELIFATSPQRGAEIYALVDTKNVID